MTFYIDSMLLFNPNLPDYDSAEFTRPKYRSKKTLRKRQLGEPKEKKEEEKEVAAPESSTALDPDSLEVHVQGMPYEVTEEDVRQFFAGCGEIQEIRLSR